MDENNETIFIKKPKKRSKKRSRKRSRKKEI